MKTALIALIVSFAIIVAMPAFARTARVVDDNDTVTLPGNVHPLARPEFDIGPTNPSLPMERMILSLHISPDKRADLDQILDKQQDPYSPNYHNWLTPEEFADLFGPDLDDINTVTRWLTSHHFVIDEVAKGRTWINFSGTAAQVERAFHTKLRDYNVGGKIHHANANDPEIPRALVDLVAGVVSLHNFPLNPRNPSVPTRFSSEPQPSYTVGTSHYLAPGDFATIYNVNPLYDAGIEGTGEAIAIAGRANPTTISTDWAAFRSIFGLPTNTLQIIVNGPNPGDLPGVEDTEANLDVQWAGAVARNSTIMLVTSQTTSATDGIHLSSQYIVDNNLAPVMSVSFGLCEHLMTTTEKVFYNQIWSQAATQGITVFVISGDWGVAGCITKNINGDIISSSIGVNGLASTPNNIAVGGTQFNEGSGSYWHSGNGPGLTSAISYIPEAAWNESGSVPGGSGLWSSGGGPSPWHMKPAWQVCPGVPDDGMRDIPDVSLTAAGHDCYLIVDQCTSSPCPLSCIGGTSVAAPAFAGLMALTVQRTGQRQGNANPRFYQLGNDQYGSNGVAVYHDITTGNNTVPDVVTGATLTGYSCTEGYDLVTGLGSVDANALVNNFAISLPPVADFRGTPTVGSPSLLVNFTDFSQWARSWNWNFGDNSTSSEQNPSHVYSTSGQYTVSLTVANIRSSVTTTKTAYITVAFPPVANFSASPKSGAGPLLVNFTDQSQWATSWSWNFGDPNAVDGINTSTQQNPTHVYSTPGQYTVTLTVSNIRGSSTATATITVASCSNLPVQIVGKTSYLTLQAAYNAAVSGDIIKAQARVFPENVTAYDPIGNKSVTLLGGYLCDYSINPGLTGIQGSLTTNSGTVTIGNFILRN